MYKCGAKKNYTNWFIRSREEIQVGPGAAEARIVDGEPRVAPVAEDALHKVKVRDQRAGREEARTPAVADRAFEWPSQPWFLCPVPLHKYPRNGLLGLVGTSWDANNLFGDKEEWGKRSLSHSKSDSFMDSYVYPCQAMYD